jgi:hypothetical protein
MNSINSRLGQATTLNSALELYGLCINSGKTSKYLILKHDKGTYSVTEKVSKLTYLFQVLGSYFGGSGPAYSAKETNKTVLSQEISNLNRDTSRYNTLSETAKIGFEFLSNKLKIGQDNYNFIGRPDFTANLPSQAPLRDVVIMREKGQRFIIDNARHGTSGHKDIKTVQRLIDFLEFCPTDEEPTKDEVTAYKILISIINRPKN